MKIIIFGCRKIAVDVIEELIKNFSNQCEILSVVTHDEERDRVYNKLLVSEFCQNNNIPYVRFDGKIPENIISDYKPDLIFSLYYRKILKKEILQIPKYGCVNIHPALLPLGRGPAPSLWNVLNGDKKAGTTMHYMVEGVDAGDIIDQKEIEIGNMTGYELNVVLSDLGFLLFKDNICSILNHTDKRVKQDHSKATYCLPFKTHLRYIHWGNPYSVINQIRAFASPFSGAMSFTESGTKVVLWDGQVVSVRSSFNPPGCYEITSDGLVIQTCTTPVIVKKYDITDGCLKTKGRFVSGPPIVC